MVYSVVVAGALVVVGAQRERVLSGQRRPARHVWLLCSVLVVLLTASVLWTTGASESAAGRGDAVAPGSTHGGEEDQVLSRLPAWLDRFGAAGAVESLRSFDAVLLSGWVMASVLCLTVLAGSVYRLRRRRSEWQCTWLLGEPVLLTKDTGPAVVGLVRGGIALPAWVLTLEPAQQSLILEHERQHRIAGDPLLMFSGLSLVALLPWNPFLWLMVRRMRRAMELDCDRRVLRDDVSPTMYAKLLVEIGARTLRGPSALTALTDSVSDLEHRVMRIVEPVRHGRWSAGARTVLGGLLLVAACMAPRPVVRDGMPAADTPPMARGVVVTTDTARADAVADTDARRTSGVRVETGPLRRGGRGRPPAADTAGRDADAQSELLRVPGTQRTGVGAGPRRGGRAAGGAGAAAGPRARRIQLDTLPTAGTRP
jgi:beta-lactamase regulating signal transducer with metallopeptidase domain